MRFPVIILGSGGHSRVLIDALRLLSIEIIGITDPRLGFGVKMVNGINILGNDDEILKYPPYQVKLVNGLGSVGDTSIRKMIYEFFKGKGYYFKRIVHPSSVIAPGVLVGEGAQIMAGAVLQTGVRIGDNTIINTRVAVDHDCFIDSHVHVAPGVTMSGEVEIGQGSHIGTGVTIIQGIKIGRNCIIGAGSVVITDVPEGTTSIGVPARVVKKNVQL